MQPVWFSFLVGDVRLLDRIPDLTEIRVHSRRPGSREASAMPRKAEERGLGQKPRFS